MPTSESSITKTSWVLRFSFFRPDQIAIFKRFVRNAACARSNISFEKMKRDYFFLRPIDDVVSHGH